MFSSNWVSTSNWPLEWSTTQYFAVLFCFVHHNDKGVIWSLKLVTLRDHTRNPKCWPFRDIRLKSYITIFESTVFWKLKLSSSVDFCTDDFWKFGTLTCLRLLRREFIDLIPFHLKEITKWPKRSSKQFLQTCFSVSCGWQKKHTMNHNVVWSRHNIVIWSETGWWEREWLRHSSIDGLSRVCYNVYDILQPKQIQCTNS